MIVLRVIGSVISFLFLVEQVSMSTIDLVEVKKIIPTVLLDIRYATNNNFTKNVVYASARCFLRKEVVEKLSGVQKELELSGLGLKIWDAYRPHSVQKKFWELVPDKRYVADPTKGSKHSRGVAVDLTLVNLNDGSELEMPTPFDEFSVKAHSDATERISPIALANRKLLCDVMSHHGFEQDQNEWWHFNYKTWRSYDLLDISFDEI